MIWASSAKVGSELVSFVVSSAPGIADTRLIGFLALLGISRREYE
jgi:hypothetical protein